MPVTCYAIGSGDFGAPRKIRTSDPGSVDQCSIQLSYGRVVHAPKRRREGSQTYLLALSCQRVAQRVCKTFQGCDSTVTRTPYRRLQAGTKSSA